MSHPGAWTGPSGLFTDLYELTMAQAYLAEGMRDMAVFELFYRDLPPTRNYVLACGLEAVVGFLEALEFTDAELDYLGSLGWFSDELLASLGELKFTGDVYAVPEGTAVFPHEPIVQVIAPITEGQLIETCLLNQVHAESVLASKAARVVTAAQGRPVVDFGARRTIGFDAALKLARASYIAGAAGTSNVEAGRRYGIPVSGTMAHSYVQAHAREADAFAHFAREFPETTLLIDTYDTRRGLNEVIRLAREDGMRVGAVRLDSGDIAALANEARQLLDEAGLQDVKVTASSSLDEWKIAELIGQGAPLDGFGVGTRLAVSKDAPDLDLAYKLVEYAGVGRMKTSAGKASLPGRKQVYRQREGAEMVRDVVTRSDEACAGEALLAPVLREGRRVAPLPDLDAIRDYAARQLAQLPPRVRALEKADPPYRVDISDALANDRQALHHKLRGVDA